MYDLMVIGGGPGGYLAAERAARSGLKTLLFEKNALGGVCLNEGCIPSKTLLNSAKLYQHAADCGVYGVHTEAVRFDQAAVIRRKEQVIRSLVSGVKGKLRRHGVQVIKAQAQILGREKGAFVVSAEGKTYEAARLLIATGSSAVIPPIAGIKDLLGSFVLTNREILELTQVPESLVVIGGGVIGLEMAAYYASVGAKVTVVELLDHIAGNTDGQIAEFLQKELEKQGITFLLGHKCLSVAPGAVTVQPPQGESFALAAEKVLLSVGRSPNVQDLGLQTLGVQFSNKGIVTDSMCRTNVEGVYAVGDVNGHHMLAHTAYREAEVAVNHMLGVGDTMRYHANPAVIYTTPEVATVGLSREDCLGKGIDFEEKTLSMAYSGRFVAENQDGDGLCKILVDKKRRTILGVHLVGSYAGEMIWGAAQMLELQLRVKDARQIIFPHPTVSEIIRETLWEFPD